MKVMLPRHNLLLSVDLILTFIEYTMKKIFYHITMIVLIPLYIFWDATDEMIRYLWEFIYTEIDT